MDLEFFAAYVAVPRPDDRTFVGAYHVVLSRCLGGDSPLDAKSVNLSDHRIL